MISNKNKFLNQGRIVLIEFYGMNDDILNLKKDQDNRSRLKNYKTQRVHSNKIIMHELQNKRSYIVL